MINGQNHNRSEAASGRNKGRLFVRSELAVFVVLLTLPVHSAAGQVVGCHRLEQPSGQQVRFYRYLPEDGFTQMQIDSAFNGILLTAEQRARAAGIVDSSWREVGRLTNPRPYEPPSDTTAVTVARLMDKRNAALLALLIHARDSSRLRQNLTAMAHSEGRCDTR